MDLATAARSGPPGPAQPAALPFTEARGLLEAEGRSARERIAAGESPFRVHAQKVLGCHSTAYRLQALALSLYNSAEWAKKAPVRLDDLLASADDDHVEAAIDMLRGYARRGENDADFMALGKQLALARLNKRGK